jgi:hypothetical protein
MPIKVFVSVGRTSTTRQEEFVSGIERHMLDHGLLPQALGRNYWSSQQPLKAIVELMNQCAGVAIIGFERLRIVEAVDRRGSDGERTLNNFALPTVWNQVEAAMAYMRGLPLLVIVEDELKQEGLLEAGYDWYVQRLPADPRAIADREFLGIFADWRSRVEVYHATAAKTAAPVEKQTGSSPTVEATAGATLPPHRRQLRIVLDTRFNDEELRTLCFDLQVDYEGLAGETKLARIISLIEYFERVQRTSEFLRYMKEVRPDVDSLLSE